jgi:hypothetical protein
MRSLENTLWDTLEELDLAHTLQTRVDCNEPNKWMIHIFHPDREHSLILIEVLVLSDSSVVTSLMERRGFSRRITESILDGLLENMESDDDESDDDNSTISSQSLEQ